MNKPQSTGPIFKSFPTEQELAALVSPEGGDSSDPRSIHYTRVHQIPVILWRRVFFQIAIPLLVCAFLFWFLYEWTYSVQPQNAGGLAGIATLICLLLYAGARAKAILIWLVQVYQRYAPVEVRNRCRFEPSCSVYMIQALEKYGVLKGLYRGSKRLRRCNASGGGYDYLP
ncbi:membrane protein insertion efficiency factor YidD [Paenibacillus sp. 7541]|uniref:membrane protein insertion efficiency factor YidD n=1 Tax=Paenibacillus sp. 7541 TaxID=2026236 RepID=UPI000BA5BD57|nr:hypothetical protein CHH75_05840 [Paenibacillus sp. 7541]